MKRILTVIMFFALLLCAVACGEGGELTVSTVESSSPDTDRSKAESKPWYDTSVPESYVSSSPEQSEPESLVQDESIVSDSTLEEGYDSLLELSGRDFESAAKGYQIAYTKSSALYAVSCVTDSYSEVTAIYDGSVTRFFSAVDGTYYCAVYGKYLFVYNNVFISGDKNGFDGTYAVTLYFDDTGAFEGYDTHPYDTHDLSYITRIYSLFDNNVYVYDYYYDSLGSISEKELYRVESGVASICQYYESVASVHEEWFANSDLIIDKSKLGKWGVFEDGKAIIPFEYDGIYSYQNETDKGVYLAEKDGRSYYFSADGTNLTPDGFDCGSEPFADRAWVFKDGQGYIIEFY